MKAVFVMFKTDGQRKDFPLSGATVVIGRRPDCALRIPVADVSRKHCQLQLNNGTLKLKDLGSANGTFVNDERVQEAELKPGDRVKIGPVTFTVQIDGRPNEILPPAADEPIEELGESDIIEEGAPPAPAMDDIGSAELHIPSDSDLLEDTSPRPARAPEKRAAPPSAAAKAPAPPPAKPAPAAAKPAPAAAKAAPAPAPEKPAADAGSDLDLDSLGLQDEGDPFAGLNDIEFESDIDIFKDEEPKK